MIKRLLLSGIILLTIIRVGMAQQAGSVAAAAIGAHPIDTTRAARIMQKLTDSLQLTTAQQMQIHRYTWYIDSCRIATIRLYHGTDSLWRYMTQAERRRDSLYQVVLTDKQFVQYGSQKSTLVLNN